MRRLFAIFALLLIVAGLFARGGRHRHHSAVEARLVVPAGGTAFPTRDGASLRLGPSLVPAFDPVLVDVAGSEVRLVFAPPAAEAFAAVTAAHPGERLALVVDGVVAAAPTIRDPITGGAVAITLRSPADATALGRALTP